MAFYFVIIQSIWLDKNHIVQEDYYCIFDFFFKYDL